eukprot:gb/GECG01010006.1/.p1 GENE.gb/GECG01010006.1/~~gb/GECG01010006.1/.p1  ORF type:complete len:159 (+),score=1.67 gb/GECG01010006.1/:1-477(+)
MSILSFGIPGTSTDISYLSSSSRTSNAIECFRGNRKPAGSSCSCSPSGRILRPTLDRSSKPRADSVLKGSTCINLHLPFDVCNQVHLHLRTKPHTQCPFVSWLTNCSTSFLQNRQVQGVEHSESRTTGTLRTHLNRSNSRSMLSELSCSDCLATLVSP